MYVKSKSVTYQVTTVVSLKAFSDEASEQKSVNETAHEDCGCLHETIISFPKTKKSPIKSIVQRFSYEPRIVLESVWNLFSLPAHHCSLPFMTFCSRTWTCWSRSERQCSWLKPRAWSSSCWTVPR